MHLLGVQITPDVNLVLFLDTGARLYCRYVAHDDELLFFGPGDENNSHGSVKLDRIIAVSVYAAMTPLGL